MLVIILDQRVRVQNHGSEQRNIHVDKQTYEGVEVYLGIVPVKKTIKIEK